MPKRKRRLYIAYGSNLNLAQMKKRCPTAKVVGTAIMRNWKLVFRSVATIERCKGFTVPVAVWEIQPKDEKALDIYEGFPRFYRKENLRVTMNGKQIRVMAYIMNDGHPIASPNLSYFNTIREGYKSAGFDFDILKNAVENSSKIIEYNDDDEVEDYDETGDDEEW